MLFCSRSFNSAISSSRRFCSVIFSTIPATKAGPSSPPFLFTTVKKVLAQTMDLSFAPCDAQSENWKRPCSLHRGTALEPGPHHQDIENDENACRRVHLRRIPAFPEMPNWSAKYCLPNPIL